MKRKSPKQYTEDFKKEAINLVAEQGYTVSQAANALGITTKLLYAWRKHREAENKPNALTWHCCKVSDEAAFCLIQRPYISKTLLTRRISPRGSP
ncbi:transposase [Providencia hangzhouensis]